MGFIFWIKEGLFEIVCKAIVSIYGGYIDTSNLNVLRYEQRFRKIVSAKTEFDIARLHPTQNASPYHLLREHSECLIWKNQDMSAPQPTTIFINSYVF